MNQSSNESNAPRVPADEEEVEEAVEDAIEFFQIDTTGSPASDADAPAPG